MKRQFARCDLPFASKIKTTTMLKTQICNSVRDTLLELSNQGAFRHYAGEYAERLSNRLQHLVGAAECLLVSSGTAAVEIALRAAGIGPGDEVLLSAYDYPGNFWAIERVGAHPVLVDVESNGWRLDAATIESALHATPKTNRRALIASHLHGQLQDAHTLREMCDSHQVFFLEDCCQAIGAASGSGSAGSDGHAAVLSFGGGKVLSAGRGGALLTSDEKVAQRAKLAAGAGSGPYGMSELQTATVLAQLEWLPQINQLCREFFSSLHASLLELMDQEPIQITMPSANCAFQTSYYQAGWLIGARSGSQSSNASITARLAESIQQLRAAGIPAGSGFDGFHRRSARRCRAHGTLANAPTIVAETFVIHHHAALDESYSPQQIAARLVSALTQAKN